jgi:hypothetical protein
VTFRLGNRFSFSLKLLILALVAKAAAAGASIALALDWDVGGSREANRRRLAAHDSGGSAVGLLLVGVVGMGYAHAGGKATPNSILAVSGRTMRDSSGVARRRETNRRSMMLAR